VIVVFGSIKPRPDLSAPESPAPGQTVLGPSMQMEPGGKGANQAVAAARDGAKVVFVGAIGRDGLAEDAVELMRSSGVDISASPHQGRHGCAAICRRSRRPEPDRGRRRCQPGGAPGAGGPTTCSPRPPPFCCNARPTSAKPRR